ncbi:MAG: FtsX-like permease family protein [Ilumatobacteraceae bacterium]
MRSGVFGADMRLWARTELRRRWLSLVVLGLLGGLAAGLTMAAYDGAQRSSSSYERMRDQLHAADAIVFPSQVRIDDFDPKVLGDLPEVESWAGFSLNSSSIDELPPFALPFIVSGADWMSTLESAHVLEGRMPDPNRDDEAVITEPVHKYVPDLKIGSTLTWRNLTKEQADKFGDALPDNFDWKTDAKGVVTHLTIVGVVRLPMESVVSFASDGLLLPSPGWAAANLAQTPVYFTNAIVRLRHGAADIPALQADIKRLTGRDDIPVKDLSTDIKRVQRSLDVEHTALLMFAAAIAVTALVLVGQAVTRATSSGVASMPVLRSMGATSGALVVGLVVPMLPTIVTAIAVASIVSIVASKWFPVGLARKVDPDLGIHVSAGREFVGLVVTAALITLLVIGTAIVMQRRNLLKRSRRTRLMSAATRAGIPVAPSIGASLAFDSGRERGGRSRVALVAAIVGVVAVVGALTLVRGIDDIVGHPERTGAGWDLLVEGVGQMTDVQAFDVLKNDSDIADFALVDRAATIVDGTDVPVYALDVRKGSMAFTVVRGSAPSADDEIALGPATMRLLGAKIGDTVKLGTKNTSLKVVGVALLSQQPHSSFDEGGWITEPAYHALVGPLPANQFFEEGFLGLADGVGSDTAIANLPQSWDVQTPASSPDLANLLQVRSLPIYLAVFLAFLAIGAVGHALFTIARQRARELAVLRALGLSARQAAASVSWQALATGLVAALAGIPLGVLLGQRVWRSITDELSFVYVGPVASLLVVLAVPACLIGCLILAIIPARGAAHHRIAEILREE